MCDECRKEYENCDFCNIKERMFNTYFSKEKKEERHERCDAWIDFDQKSNGDILWYAVLNGDQYTDGHSIVILGCHMNKITELISVGDKRKEKLQAMMEGINKVSYRLKEELNAQAVHVLCLCEGMAHLHFHLIPRYNYKPGEEEFFRKNFEKRYNKLNRI